MAEPSDDVNRRKRIFLAIVASDQLLESVMSDSSSSSDSGNENDTVPLRMRLRMRGSRRKPARVEGYVLNTIPRMTCKSFREHFRMTAATFDMLETRLGPALYIENDTGRPMISVRNQLLSVGDPFGMGESSVSDCFVRVIRVLNEIASDIIVWPVGNMLIAAEENFRRIGGLPYVIGAIDGTDIEVKGPKVSPQLGPWSEILEDWITMNDGNVSARQAKVMKLGDKGLTVSHKGVVANKRDVSETDLYLLSAIEKLVYRVNSLEKRLRRSEELLYYVISGNNNVQDSCPSNFSRVGKNCYHFSYREFDWKSSASVCRGMGGNLVELETVEENQDLVTHLQSTKNLKGKMFWTAGLNPGLLWIWAGSARPVHQDTKQTVNGTGRCLKLDYNTTSRIYSYKGEDCGTRHRYICEMSKDDELINEVERMTRAQRETADQL